MNVFRLEIHERTAPGGESKRTRAQIVTMINYVAAQMTATPLEPNGVKQILLDGSGNIVGSFIIKAQMSD